MSRGKRTVQGNVEVQGMGIFFLLMPLAQTPGPDLVCQDAVMESEAFISSENSCISTSRRTSRSRPGLGTGRAGLI